MAAVYIQTKTYLREFNFPIDRVGGYTKTDAIVTYSDPSGHWRIQGYVNNLEGRAIRNGAFTVLGHYFSDYNLPRVYGARVSYQY
jgi:iron complex outermembrane recepter protein